MDSKHKTRTGRVISNKMEKTVVVAVETARNHPIYKKTIKRVVKYKVHDPKSQCGEGDVVRIVESRPISREKHWRVAEVVAKKEVAAVKPAEI
ncbi:MAG: 30S ribosomal protein S17 [Chloroflexi bacterium]|nr:30S ribosomal protein S17 [Chloroflexota bacterium]